MSIVKSIIGFFSFIVGGLVAIIVGSFMIRGTMHMWDNDDSSKNGKKDDDHSNSSEQNSKDN